MAKLIYSMITSLDGYAEAAEGDLGTGRRRPRRCTPSSATASAPSARTSTASGLPADRLLGRPHTPSPTCLRTSSMRPRLAGRREDRVLHNTGVSLVSQGPDRRTCKPGRRARSTRPRLITTSPSTARTSRRRRSQPAWWTSTACSSPRAWSAAASRFFPDGVRPRSRTEWRSRAFADEPVDLHTLPDPMNPPER